MVRLAAERRLSSLDSFIQECLQVVTALNTNVAQQMLNHLQDDVINDDQQPVKPLHPHSHSPKAHDDTVSCIIILMSKSKYKSNSAQEMSRQTNLNKFALNYIKMIVH